MLIPHFYVLRLMGFTLNVYLQLRRCKFSFAFEPFTTNFSKQFNLFGVHTQYAWKNDQ